MGKLLNLWGTLSPLAKLLLILLAAPLLVLNAWALAAIAGYFHSLIAILAGGTLIAFLLDFPISFMEQRGAKRGRAAIIVFLLALTLVIALGFTLFPLALRQAEQFVAFLPRWLESGRHQLVDLNNKLSTSGLPIDPDALAGQINEPLKNELQNLGKEALSVAGVTVSSLLDALLTIVLAFYLVQHGDVIWRSLLDWLPADLRQPFSITLRRSFQNYFLGQLILGSCMGICLTVVFLLLQVPFGLLFGLAIGTMALIPFGGTVGIILISVLVLLRDFALGIKVLIVCVLVQQILENLIAPRVIGKVTGLNPFWVLLSVLVGARVGGLLGVIIAVPIAVIIKSSLVSLRTARTSSVLPESAMPIEEGAAPLLNPPPHKDI
jgi:predicted PurR-regulated permease PerM